MVQKSNIHHLGHPEDAQERQDPQFQGGKRPNVHQFLDKLSTLFGSGFEHW